MLCFNYISAKIWISAEGNQSVLTEIKNHFIENEMLSFKSVKMLISTNLVQVGVGSNHDEMAFFFFAGEI